MRFFDPFSNPFSLAQERASVPFAITKAAHDAILWARLEGTALALEGEGEPHYGCNGVQLVAKLPPRLKVGHGHASDTLNRHAGSLVWLMDKDWLINLRRNRPPYGYGDDQEFFLTDKALAAFNGKGTDKAVRLMVSDALDGLFGR